MAIRKHSMSLALRMDRGKGFIGSPGRSPHHEGPIARQVIGINPPVGDVYHAIEGSKGELGFYLVSDGKGNPWKCKIRSPSFIHIQSLPHLVKGRMISDVVAIIGSIDPIMGEADK